MTRSRWYRSFYWRIGISFLVLVVGVIVVQSVMFSAMMRSASMAPRAPHLRATSIATEIGSTLSSEPSYDVAAYLRRTHGSDRQQIYVVEKDGGVSGNTSQPLADETRRSALAMLGVLASDPRTDRGGQTPTGPVITAPILVAGQLRAMVVMPPPPIGGFSREVGRMLSLPGTLVLFAATMLATWVIFRPAQRRLSALEDAALRLGSGDLTSRAPDSGGDEIARVAQAFNRMAGELATREAALRAADTQRRQMLADVSHELRTPLTTMRGYLETLRMPEVESDAPTRERYLETVERETRRLERIVQDLLDLARLEGGGGTHEPRLFAIERIFSAIVRRHERALTARQIVARTSIDEAADQVMGDPDRLEQVVENLFANAVRHAPDGSTVELRAEMRDGTVRLTVSDQGRGIPADHLPHLFDRFYKADAGRAAADGGSGLGLSIVKAIVERHGGAITATSEPGRTEFVVTLPSTPDA
jgi:signal transduction histidine kinase